MPTVYFTGMFDHFYESQRLLHVLILLASIILTLVLILAAQRTETGTLWSRGVKLSKALN